MPNLCHRTPEVYTALIEYAVWLMDNIGFDGFRYDCAAGYGAWMVRAIQELNGLNQNKAYQPFGVAECWESLYTIQEWMNECNSWSDNPCAAFDFILRGILKNICDTFGYSLTNLTQGGTILAANPALAVTFVENHDLTNPGGITYNPIINDKMMAYSIILTHQGYPCVFWQDYYNYGLAQEGNNSGIAALVYVHEQYAGGDMEILYCDDNLYIIQRKGWQVQKGLVYVLNNLGSWNGATVQTQWSNTNFTPLAWRGHNNADTPEAKQTDAIGNGDFWAPPRGYAVYVPA
jgi:alpha-amylase